MDFVETVIFNGVNYIVEGSRVFIDDSFSHEFGIERGHHFEVEDLEILEAFDEYEEARPFDNTDEQLMCELAQILEDKFNGI